MTQIFTADDAFGPVAFSRRDQLAEAITSRGGALAAGGRASLSPADQRRAIGRAKATAKYLA